MTKSSGRYAQERLLRMSRPDLPAALSSWKKMECCADRIFPVVVKNPTAEEQQTYLCYEDNDRQVFFVIVVENVSSGMVLHLTNALFKSWKVSVEDVYREAKQNVHLLGETDLPTTDDMLIVGQNAIDLAMVF
ncbi:MAG: hypothetical protein Q4B26_21015 [Eubacteriales bacterium]|nr:hypothetical protein [Eubacteriales bacterium]